MALAKKLGLNTVYVFTGKNNEALHVVVKHRGNLYDASGKTSVRDIRSIFGEGVLVRKNIKPVIKYLGKKDLIKSKLWKDASKLVNHGSGA